jgi:hypothetical protein
VYWILRGRTEGLGMLLSRRYIQKLHYSCVDRNMKAHAFTINLCNPPDSKRKENLGVTNFGSMKVLNRSVWILPRELDFIL